jgi:flagellar hook-associated protein 3 FlgL
MRIASKSYMDLLQQGIRQAEGDLATLTQRISSGRRINRPSDDPIGASQAIRAHATLDTVRSQNTALTRAGQLNDAVDAALGELSQPLQSASDAAMKATQIGIGEAGLLACAQEVRAAMQRVITIGNSEFSGTYLFAGTNNTAPALSETPGPGAPVAYDGNESAMNIEVAPNRSVELTVTGQQLFNYEDAGGNRPAGSVNNDLFATMKNLADAIESGDIDAVNDLRGQMDTLRDHVVAERGRLGATGLRLEQSIALTEDAELQCKTILAEVEDTDMVKALTEAQRQKTCYQAALAATSMISNMPTLFDSM